MLDGRTFSARASTSSLSSPRRLSMSSRIRSVSVSVISWLLGFEAFGYLLEGRGSLGHSPDGAETVAPDHREHGGDDRVDQGDDHGRPFVADAFTEGPPDGDRQEEHGEVPGDAGAAQQPGAARGPGRGA